MLREMRTQMAEFRGETMERFDSVELRLTKLEEQRANFKNALTADSLPSNLVTGEFESRIELLERKVKELEAMR